MASHKRPEKPIDRFIAHADQLVTDLDRMVKELTAAIEEEGRARAKKAD